MKFPRPRGISAEQNNLLASPEARHGTPDEIMEQAQRAREAQRGGAWSPAVDALESFAYSSPVTQNQAFADEAGPLASPWQKYGSVLNARGAQLNPRAYGAEPNLPAGYTQGQLDTENADALGGGAAPRWTQSQNLPSSQQRIAGSLAGLRRSAGGR